MVTLSVAPNYRPSSDHTLLNDQTIIGFLQVKISLASLVSFPLLELEYQKSENSLAKNSEHESEPPVLADDEKQFSLPLAALALSPPVAERRD